MAEFPIVDSHLDLAENVTLFGRDQTLPVAEIRRKENRRAAQAMVSLPALVEGGIAVAIATVTGGFLVEDVGEAAVPRSAFYSTPQEAEAQALSQIRLYENWAAQGRVRLLKSARDLDDHLPLWVEDRKPGLVLLMEGADPIVEVGDLPAWWARGLRMIGLTFGDTRYGVGVGGGSPVYKRGGLTEDGARMLEQMAELEFIWDISHLAEDGVWQGLEMKFPRVCASHANARTLTPTDRHLSDGVIRALGERGGVIGMVLYNGFLEPRWQEDQTTQVTLSEHLRRQSEHFAKLAGWEVVGIGSDLDGGFGLEESPVELQTIADFSKVGDVVPEAYREAVLSTNWLNFLRRALP